MGAPVTLVDPQGKYVDIGGGGGPSEVTISGPVAVTGPVTEGELTAVVGLLSAGAYSDDTGAADGSVIGLLKGIYVQNSQIITLLTAIEENTNTGAQKWLM